MSGNAAAVAAIDSPAGDQPAITTVVEHATSDDFAWKLGLDSPGWWTVVGMKGRPSGARPQYMQNFEDDSCYTPEGRARSRARVENFATQLRRRGFAAVQLCPEDLQYELQEGVRREREGDGKGVEKEPEDGDLEKQVLCQQFLRRGSGNCNTKLEKYFPVEDEKYDHEELHPNEAFDPENIEWDTCCICGVKEYTTVREADPRSAPYRQSPVFWSCSSGECNPMCDACYQDRI